MPSLRLPAALLATFLPSAYFFLHVHQHRDSHGQERRIIDLGNLVRTYLLAGILGTSLSMLIQSILSYLIALLSFRNNATVMEYLTESMKKSDVNDQVRTTRRREMSRNPRYWLFILLFCFLGPGLIEEGTKYLAIVFAVGRDHQLHLSKNGVADAPAAGKFYLYLFTGCTAGLAFATFENVAFFVGAALSSRESGEQNNPTEIQTQPHPGDDPLSLLSVLERVLIATPGHTMAGALIGMNLLTRGSSRRLVPTIDVWEVLRDPVLLHGLWDFWLLAVSAWEGNVGWQHPRTKSTICVALLGVIGVQVILASLLWDKLSQY
ncbi:hypothetical protein H2200_007951 [Cladophialophora chaetospira]|uniref:Uncharacterized protein n=1 Tax=Cladophialophora chaetospira TaxID=386627 RepID=A0AA39CGY7_9EURO|nr:hypothetical protein H2200_007951 [Cladophialophora chaetospira]